MTFPTLHAAFTTSRATEFLSEKELVAQSGAPRELWPLMITRELIDNALDAAEEAGVPPRVELALTDDSITVTDHGPGIDPATVQRIADFTTRTSSREAWIAPSRGRQGNALPVILGMAHVLGGAVEIASRGVRHRIVVEVDDLRREPRVLATAVAEPSVRSGTIVQVCWPDSAGFQSDDQIDRFLSLATGYSVLNPHLTLTIRVDGETRLGVGPRSCDWRKWRPSDPSPPHWFDDDDLTRLIGAILAHAEDGGEAPPTLRDFVRRFAGLTGTQKAARVLHDSDLAGQRLSDLVHDGRLDLHASGRLRAAMIAHGRPIKPKALGVIGKDHLARGCEDLGADPGSFRYKRVEGETEAGVPWLFEMAFAWCPEGDRREEVWGINWSPTLVEPFGALTWHRTLQDVLANRWAGHGTPVVVAAHLVHPKVRYGDRGKQRATLEPDIRQAIVDAAEHVTAAWDRQLSAEFRNRQREQRRSEALRAKLVRRTTIKDAASVVMEQAYLKVSDGGQLPANARQIYYAARGPILELTGNEALDSNYFTQTLLPDFMVENPDMTAGWDVVFDARGNAREPHTGQSVPLGTLAVRHYLADVERGAPSPSPVVGLDDLPLPGACPTIGPESRFGALLYIEKEGFGPLLQATRIAERFDLMTVGGKGQSTTAARTLVDRLAGRFGLPLLIAHDFDKAGLEITRTLSSDTRRYSFEHEVEIHDLGLRLDDVETWSLESEDVAYSSDPRGGLERAGATADEIAFLRRTAKSGRRVELNAFTSRDLMAWLEQKLVAAGVAKVIPDDGVLSATWRRLATLDEMRRRLPALMAEAAEHAARRDVPADLRDRLAALLADRPQLPWEEALAMVSSTSSR